ncbi:MAG: RidA family protein [Gemmatimonadales bacterium]|nr:RidA family protein [Gemmatimonadales bacterium]
MIRRLPTRVATLTVALLMGAGPLAAQATREILPQAPRPGANLSSIVKVGDMLYLSGQLGFAPGQGLVPGGVGPETRQTMTNIKTLLESVGSGMDRVVKCTVYLADIADFQAMNTEYRTFFPSEPPARTTVAVSGLVSNARIEVTCMALAGR